MVRKDVDKKFIKRLKSGLANITMLIKEAGCDRYTARAHLAELEADGLIMSVPFGRMRIYCLKEHEYWLKKLMPETSKRKKR